MMEFRQTIHRLARAPGFTPRRVVIDWSSDPEEVRTIEMARAIEERSSMTVLLPDGDPLPYARISLGAAGRPQAELWTDRLGRVRFSPAGTDARCAASIGM